MRRRSCADLAELRSAYVDGALADGDRERVLAHLTDCADCRVEVAELRRVRALLTRHQPVDPGAPADLSTRLVSIAGSDAAEPLWTRPFRRAPAGTLTSDRGRIRRRAFAALAAAGSTAALVVGIGYVAAPANPWPAVADPRDEAITDFSAVAAQLPLSSRSAMVAAVVSTTPVVDPPAATPVLTGQAVRQLSVDQSRQRLLDAYGAAGARSFAGTQVFRAVRGKQDIVSTARVDGWAGQGTRVNLFDRTGRQVSSRYFPAPTSARLIDESSLSLLATNFQLTGWTAQWAVGRPATVVEARQRASSQSLTTDSGTVVARWWLDDAAGLVLWQETYDSNGVVLTATGFSSVEVGAAGHTSHLPARASLARTSASLTLGQLPDLRSQGWVCADQLGGLSMVRLRSDQTANPGVVHGVYSDGLSTLSVFEQRGELIVPGDAVWDDRTGAFVTLGNPSTATWQSADTVFTLVTDGSEQTLADAVNALPHDGDPDATTIERVRAGWARIFTSISG